MKKLTRLMGATASALTLFLLTGLPAQSDPPALKISPLGANQFNIIITNGVATTNYTLFWTDVIGDVNYPWLPIWVGELGQTNFAVEVADPAEQPHGFFKVLLGSDSDGDGVLEQQDADSSDPGVGILTVIINSPANNSTIE